MTEGDTFMIRDDNTRIAALRRLAGRLAVDTTGATAITYGLLAALIAVAAITATRGLGNELRTTFSTTGTSIRSGTTAA